MRLEQEVNVAKLLVEEGEHEVELRGCGERIEVRLGDVTTRCKGLGVYSDQREKGQSSFDLAVWSDTDTTLTVEVVGDLIRFRRGDGKMSESHTGLRIMTVPTAQKQKVEYEYLSAAPTVVESDDDLLDGDELDLS